MEGGVGVCAPGFEGLKIISAGKDGSRERVPVLEVIGTNVLANEVVRHFSNLTAKICYHSYVDSNGSEVKDVSVFKDLGVTFDHSLICVDLITKISNTP